MRTIKDLEQSLRMSKYQFAVITFDTVDNSWSFLAQSTKETIIEKQLKFWQTKGAARLTQIQLLKVEHTKNYRG